MCRNYIITYLFYTTTILTHRGIGICDVKVEANYIGNNERADLGFVYKGVPCSIELKTPNTNWRIKGIANKTRPITKNINSIILDCKKLDNCHGKGIVAFVLFPIPIHDDRWLTYIDKISQGIGKEITAEEDCTRIQVPIGEGDTCEVVVCCFIV